MTGHFSALRQGLIGLDCSSLVARQTCFVCTTSDGRTVTLYKDRYDDHILAEHPELKRDFGFPAQNIEHALMNAEHCWPGRGKARIYIGPAVQANPPAGAQRIHVVTVPEAVGNGWWVITAYGEPVSG
jgi:hypothetical protein